jgi:hypothetical protein
MDKKDLMYLAAALALVLVIALVIKPIVTGQPINTGIPTPTPVVDVTQSPLQNSSSPVRVVVTLTANITTIPTTPVPTWNPAASETVGFVNPANYGVSLNDSLPGGTRFNTTSLNTNMTTFSTITASSSGTTGIFYMPFPYWELVYTVKPTPTLTPSTSGSSSNESTTKSSSSSNSSGSGSTGVSHSGISGSFSTAAPQFTLQVMDGDDPNRIVRTITPPGGINLDLWTGAEREVHENSAFRSNQLTYTTISATDPRPWTEKFYEGQRRYFFIITAQSLDSYTISIKVPTRYIGKY